MKRACLPCDSDKIKKSKLCQSEKEIINENNLNIEYSLLFRKERADELFEKLENEITYLDPESARVIVYGRSCLVPRRVAAFGNKGVKYKFSGNTYEAKEWTPVLKELKSIVEEKTGETFNFVLVNRYKDGKDYIGYHRDNEPDIIKGSVIVSLSFGQEREFIFKNTVFGIKKLILEPGSLLVMKHPTNKYWYHSLPKMPGIQNARINLTFRRMRVSKKH